MANIIRLRNAWYSNFVYQGHRIHRKLGTDRREASIELGRLLDSMRGGAAGRLRASWPEFKARYLEYSEGAKSAGTLKRDKAAISALEKAFPIGKIDQITPELLERWKGQRIKEGKGKATVNRDITAIKAMLKKAVAWGYIKSLDWKSVKTIKTARGRLLFYTPEALGSLIARCRGCWLAVALLGARAGLRRGEIHWLEWQDVDFNRNRIHVCPKDGWQPKDYEARFIPMSKDLRAHLLSLPKAGRWVIAELDGSRPGLDVMSSYFRKLSRKCGLSGSIHTLRHTFASHLAQAGVSLKVIKDLLGHADMATTEIYAHLSPETFEAAVSKLPALKCGSGCGSGKAVLGFPAVPNNTTRFTTTNKVFRVVRRG